VFEFLFNLHFYEMTKKCDYMQSNHIKLNSSSIGVLTPPLHFLAIKKDQFFFYIPQMVFNFFLLSLKVKLGRRHQNFNLGNRRLNVIKLHIIKVVWNCWGGNKVLTMINDNSMWLDCTQSCFVDIPKKIQVEWEFKCI